MGIEFINKVIVISILLALALVIATSSYYGIEFGIGILVGAAWSCLNLYFIKTLMISALNPAAKSYFNLILLLGIKFPILYAAAYFILISDYFSIFSLLAGFSITFLVILIKGIFVWLFESKEKAPS